MARKRCLGEKVALAVKVAAFVVLSLAVLSKGAEWAGRMPSFIAAEAAEGDAASGGARVWRVVKTAGVVASLVVLGFVVLVKLVRFVCIAREPKLDSPPAILSQGVRSEGDRKIIGKSWIRKRHGIWQMYLEGDPFEIGYSNAKLTEDLIEELETNLLRTIELYVPYYAARWLLGHSILIRNRALPRYVPDEYKMELLGLSRGLVNRRPRIAPLYQRWLGYHAAHDIGHSVEDSSFTTRRAVEDSPLAIRRRAAGDSISGCTAFAAWGDHVSNGHVIVGRNCDLEAGPCVDVNKIVTLFRPREGNPFVSVSWAGWLGVPTGMNDKRLFVSINAGRSGDRRSIGTPVSFVARQVLQYASTIDEAVEIIRKAEMFVSEAFLLADGKTGKAVVVEKSPARTDVYSPPQGYLVSANHFLTDTFRDDPANREFIRTATSLARADRMEELVVRERGTLDVRRAADVLRDRRGKNDLDVGSGNRSTVNPLIATHSVIADVTTGTAWVSASPHQLGAYVPFNVNDFEDVDEDAIVPEDPFLTDGGYDGYLRSEELLTRGERLVRSGEFDEAQLLLDESAALNPNYYRIFVVRGELELKRGDVAGAERSFRRALELQPPFLRHREMIERLLRKAECARQAT